jgi:uncharacterized membrane protein YjjB (DUF3815 family)
VRGLTAHLYDLMTASVLDTHTQRRVKTGTNLVVVAACCVLVPSSLVMINLWDFQCGAISGQRVGCTRAHIIAACI